MSTSQRPTAIVRSEPAAVPYALRSPVADLLNSDEARAAITPLVPHGVDYERVILEVYQAHARNPQIMQCKPESIILAVGKAVASGLAIGETIHLVPFGKTLEAIRDFKGDIELVVRSGAARAVIAKCVYANEPYRYTEGTTTEIVHQPIMDPKLRGPMIGGYAVARLPHYGVAAVQMSVQEVDAIRQKYSQQWKRGELPDWYVRKTCVHQLTKMLPKNPKLAEVLAMFEREDKELDESLKGSPAAEEIVDAEVSAAPDAASHSSTSNDVEKQAQPAVVEPAVGSTEWARAFRLPFKKSEAYNTPLANISVDGLEQLAAWIREKQKENGAAFHAETLQAIELVIKDAERQQTTILGEEEDVPQVAVAAAPTPTNPTTLAPGKIEDAIDAPAPKETLAMVSASVVAMLRDDKLDADEKKRFKEDYDRADTVEAMQALRARIERHAKLPF